MKLLIQIIIYTALALYLGGLEFSLKPFVFKLHDWRLLLGIVCLIAAMTFYRTQAHLDGYNQACDDIKEVIEETKKEYQLTPKEDEKD